MTLNLRTINKFAAVLASFGFITGCAPMISGVMNATVTDDVVMAKTIKYFGASQKEITVSRIEKGALATSYQTKYSGKLYNCNIYYGEVTCKQPGA